MKQKGMCQSCGKDSQGWSKCNDCRIPYKRRASKPKKHTAVKKNWREPKPIKLASGAELLSRLEMPEYIQSNNMGEAWTK